MAVPVLFENPSPLSLVITESYVDLGGITMSEGASGKETHVSFTDVCEPIRAIKFTANILNQSAYPITRLLVAIQNPTFLSDDVICVIVYKESVLEGAWVNRLNDSHVIKPQEVFTFVTTLRMRDRKNNLESMNYLSDFRLKVVGINYESQRGTINKWVDESTVEWGKRGTNFSQIALPDGMHIHIRAEAVVDWRGEKDEIVPDKVVRYLWIERDNLLKDAACITFVKSSNRDEVLGRFGGDLAASRWITLGQTLEADINNWQQRYQDQDELELSPFGNDMGVICADYEYTPHVLAGSIGEWIVLIEVNGFEATRHEVVQQVSRGTEMISVFWNVNSVQKFAYSVDGREVTSFELQFPEERRGNDPDRLLDYMLELPFNSRQRLASAFALAELVTTVRFEQDWLEAKLRLVKVIPLPKEPHPDLKPEHTELARNSPEVATPIRSASTGALRRIALLAAERAVRETELDCDPAVQSALEALQQGAPDLANFRTNLVPLLQQLEGHPRGITQEAGLRWETSEQAGYIAYRRTCAAYAVRNALWPLPVVAALEAVNEASRAVSDKESLFRDVISLAIHSQE